VVNPDRRKWGGVGLLAIVGVIAAWASPGLGFVIGGLILTVAGCLALVRSSGPSAAGSRRQILSNGSLILVGILLIVYGLS
jgi:hypothetical protein